MGLLTRQFSSNKSEFIDQSYMTARLGYSVATPSAETPQTGHPRSLALAVQHMSVFEDLERRDFSAWVPILEAVARPARHPQFHELTPDGEWNDWSSCPELPDEEPIHVKQPDSTQVFSSVGGTERSELS